MKAFRPSVFTALALVFVLAACSTPEDLTSTPTLEPQFGSADDDIGIDVATASRGRIYTLSQRNGPRDRNGYPDGYGNYSSVFLQRQDSSGAVIWAKQIDWSVCDPDPDYLGSDCGAVRAVSLVADAQGNANALTVSTYRGTSMDVDYESLTYSVKKYNAAGQYVSSVNLSAQEEMASLTPGAVAFIIDASGNVLITHKDHSSGSGSYVVAKYASNGTLLWQRASTVGIPYGIAVTSAGNVYVIGSLGMARYSSSGSLIWTKTGSGYAVGLYSQIVSSGSNLYVRDVKVIRKYDASGKLLWTRPQSGLNTIVLQDLTADGSGNVYLSGKYDADSSSKLSMNAFARKLSPSGSVLWTKTYGTPAYDDARGIATLSGSEIYVTGETQGSLAHPNLGGPENRDSYLRKLNSSGNPLWTR